MSKNAWLTPDDPATMAYTCIQVYYPETDEFRAALRGALRLLEMEGNWEQFGDMTPGEAADYWLQANEMSMGFADCQSGDNMPPGTIIMGGWSSAPSGYLLCDGASYDTSTYADLFAAIGYQFGGSGSNFNVPNFENRFPTGAGDNYVVGDTGGIDGVSLNEYQNGPHSHIMQQMGVRSRSGGSGVYDYSQVSAQQTTTVSGEGQPHENRPPYCALNFAIKT